MCVCEAKQLELFMLYIDAHIPCSVWSAISGCCCGDDILDGGEKRGQQRKQTTHCSITHGQSKRKAGGW